MPPMQMSLPVKPRVVLVLAILLLTVACDQSTKRWARATLTAGTTRSLVQGHVQLILAENEGAFLGLGENLPSRARFLIFTILVGIALVLAFRWLVGPSRPPHQILSVGLLIGGGTGNVIDRISRHGAVTDFLVLRYGAVTTGIFNVADVFVTVAACSMLLSLWKRKQHGAQND